MDPDTIPRAAVALGVIGILGYWHWAEYFQSQADKAKSHHSPTNQVVQRVLPLLVGAILLLQLLGFLNVPLPMAPPLTRLLYIVGQLVFWSAALVAVWARRAIGNNWAHAADYQIIPGQRLVTRGPYAYIRHPIYAAFLGMFIGAELVVGSWLVMLALPLSWRLRDQLRREEQLLRHAFGRDYEHYQQRTGALLPRATRRE